MEIVNSLWSWIISNILDILLVFVGASAIFIYLHQKKTEVKNAATLILEQIDSVEDTIVKLKEDYAQNGKEFTDEMLYLTNEIDYAGAWSQYQYLITNKLSQADRTLLQDFFHRAYQIEKGRADVVRSFYYTWDNKSLVLNLICGKFHDPTYKVSGDGKELDQRNALIAAYAANNNSSHSFVPGIAYKLLAAELENFTRLKGTTAYNILQKMSYRDK